MVVTQLLSGLTFAFGLVAIASAISWHTTYRTAKENHRRYIVFRVSRIILSGNSFDWDDLKELYKREAGGMMPTHEDARFIFREAEEVVAAKALPTGDKAHIFRCKRNIQAAQDTVPDGPTPWDTEYVINTMLFLLLVTGALGSLANIGTPSRDWLGALGVGATVVIPGALFIFQAILVRKQAARILRARRSVEF